MLTMNPFNLSNHIRYCNILLSINIQQQLAWPKMPSSKFTISGARSRASSIRRR